MLPQEWVETITSKGMDMKPSRFTEEPIIGILREQEAGAKTADVCRKHGVSGPALNSRGVRTARGRGWHVSNAKNLVDRLPA